MRTTGVTGDELDAEDENSLLSSSGDAGGVCRAVI